MSTGGSESRQARAQDTSGGNIVGKGPTKHKQYTPPAFMGKSGQPDNQSTSRGKGTN